jgi:hypothetical protein
VERIVQDAREGDLQVGRVLAHWQSRMKPRIRPKPMKIRKVLKRYMYGSLGLVRRLLHIMIGCVKLWFVGEEIVHAADHRTPSTMFRVRSGTSDIASVRAIQCSVSRMLGQSGVSTC